MPLDFGAFRKNPRYCKPLVLADEDQPQDIEDWKRMEREDQERQYREYCAQWDEAPVGLPGPEKPIVRGSDVKFDRVAYQRDYMKQWRAKKKLEG